MTCQCLREELAGKKKEQSEKTRGYGEGAVGLLFSASLCLQLGLEKEADEEVFVQQDRTAGAAEKAAAFRKWQESELQNRGVITAVSGS